jgi:uncharacterized protein (TIGR02147 family)
MEEFRHQLQREFLRRTAQNPAYSLRAFAKQLKINHATLSTLLAGRRKITQATIERLGRAIGLGPAAIQKYGQASQQDYVQIEEDVFASLSNWYLDAILELTRIADFKLEPKNVARVLSISVVQAKLAIETLLRLKLIDQKMRLSHSHTTNILDPEFTSVAQRQLQKAILQKSLEAVDQVSRTRRDHSSVTMAVNTNDMPKVKELIQKFRRDLDRFVQREGTEPDEVYQLQVSFFPLSQIKGEHK